MSNPESGNNEDTMKHEFTTPIVKEIPTIDVSQLGPDTFLPDTALGEGSTQPRLKLVDDLPEGEKKAA